MLNPFLALQILSIIVGKITRNMLRIYVTVTRNHSSFPERLGIRSDSLDQQTRLLQFYVSVSLKPVWAGVNFTTVRWFASLDEA